MVVTNGKAINPGGWKSNNKAPKRSPDQEAEIERARITRAAAERSSRDQKSGKKPVTLSHDVRKIDYLKG